MLLGSNNTSPNERNDWESASPHDCWKETVLNGLNLERRLAQSSVPVAHVDAGGRSTETTMGSCEAAIGLRAFHKVGYSKFAATLKKLRTRRIELYRIPHPIGLSQRDTAFVDTSL